MNAIACRVTGVQLINIYKDEDYRRLACWLITVLLSVSREGRQ